MQQNQLVLFNSTDGNVTIDVTVDQDTMWLSLNQLAELFERDKSVISRHLKNIFTSEELNKNSVVAFFATTASDSKSYQVEHFNLDVILSVGYRVNSKQATLFRRWANSVLKDYLLKGYALNKNLIDTKTKEYQHLIDILGKTLINNQLVNSQGQNIVGLITMYANTWTTLLQYDEDRLNLPANTLHKNSLVLNYEHAITAISKFKQQLMVVNEATELLDNWNSMQTTTKYKKIKPLI